MPRFEKKFVVSLADYYALQSQLQLIAQPDPYSEVNGRYPIISRYFDTEDLEFYNQKIEGEFTHCKLRQRVYGNSMAAAGEVYLEAKIKARSEQIKIRIATEGCHQAGAPKCPYQAYFQEVLATRSLRVICHVYYEREAFHWQVAGQTIRINFDHNITALPPDRSAIADADFATSRLDPGQNILLEIKSDRLDLPPIVSQVLARADTKPLTFSKYIWAYEYLLTAQPKQRSSYEYR